MRALLSRSLPLATAFLLVLALPGAALAGSDGVRETSRTTYTLVPEDRLVRVKTTIKLTNDRPRKGRAMDSWLSVRLPHEASSVEVEGGVSLGDPLEADAIATTRPIVFKKPVKPGKKRSVTIRYELTSIPWLPLSTRVAPDYAHFCWSGMGSRKGTVEARIPAGWTADTTLAPVTTTDGAHHTTLAMPAGRAPEGFFACTDAFQTGSVDRVYILSPDEQLITIDAWASDLGWKDAMSQVVATDLRALRQLIGVAMPIEELRIQEVARTMPLYSGSDYRADDSLLYVDENIDQVGVPTVALARTWFSPSTIAEPWLEHGLGLWSGLQVMDRSCPAAGVSPVDPSPSLNEPQDHAASLYELDHRTLEWQGSIACDIVGRVADAIGSEAMTEVTTELLSRSEPAGWQAWLDSVEPRLAAADGADPTLARELLLGLGLVTPESLAEYDR